MSRSLSHCLLALVASLIVLFASSEASAQCIANPVPNEPPICENLTPPPVETGTLTRDGGLVLPPGAAQAGGGPGIDLQSGRLGLPLSAAFGASDTLEFGVGWTSYLTPPPWRANYFGPWLQQMFVSNLSLYGRYSVIPKKFAISTRVTVLGPLIRGTSPFTPMLIIVDAPFTTELSDAVRLYWVNSVNSVVGAGFQMQLSTSPTFMFMLNEVIYLQAVTVVGTGFATGAGSSKFVVPYKDQAIQFGTGGGLITGENEGVGLALMAGFAQPQTVAGTAVTTGGGSAAGGSSALLNLGLIATYVKAI